MTTVNLILSGLGGQGILFMTKILALTALHKGTNVLGAETHGMAQRGGSVVSHLKIGDTENSLVNTGGAHYLLALERHEAYRNLHFLAQGGRLFVNTDAAAFPHPEVADYLARNGMVCRTIPAGRIALERKAPRAVNLALLGSLAASPGEAPFDAADIRRTIERITPERFRQANLEVFDAGAAWGR